MRLGHEIVGGQAPQHPAASADGRERVCAHVQAHLLTFATISSALLHAAPDCYSLHEQACLHACCKGG